MNTYYKTGFWKAIRLVDLISHKEYGSYVLYYFTIDIKRYQLAILDDSFLAAVISINDELLWSNTAVFKNDFDKNSCEILY